MSTGPYSAIELEDLQRLRELGDDDIDLSDIPEIRQDQWDDPRRPKYELAASRPVDLPIDGKVAHWFAAHVGDGQPVETEINRVLRDYVREQQRRAG